MRLMIATMIAALLFSGCAEKPKTDRAATDDATSSAAFMAAVDDARILTASAKEEWLTYGGTYDEQRHSTLSQINRANVSDLGVAWTYDLATNRGVESTPIVVDGVMYVTSAWSVVYALDAKTGEELWVHEPDVDRAVGVKACCDVVNRGVAVYDGKIFVGVIDGRLQALDAMTGQMIWETITVDQSKPYTITGAPRVVKDMVLIGNGGAELGVRGYISAYDVNTGEKVWRFYTVPNPEKIPDGEISDAAFETVGNVTWGDTGAWITDGGGGTVWDSIVYDAVHDRIIFGVGNGSPWSWQRRDPSGLDNLFLSSIVAVDAKTGSYAWHFQTTPGDTWDYTATQTIILADLPLGDDGATRRVAMQAPKNGFFYVIDAEDGAFIQAAPFVPQNWTTGLTEEGRPIVTAEARDQAVPFFQTPGPLGAHNWHPMAFNPDLGLAYIPAQEIPAAYVIDPLEDSRPGNWNTGIDFAEGTPPDFTPEIRAMIRPMLKGRLIAWDPVANAPRWTYEHSNAWNGGVLSTAGGLVFQGQLEGTFAAFDAASGEKLWDADVKSGAASGPGTYMIDGEQYITITTGWGSAYALSAGFAYDEAVGPTIGKVVTFKLGGQGTIADVDLPQIETTPKAARFGDAEMIANGLTHYARNCAVCHGPYTQSSGVLPDLRWSEVTGDSELWYDIVYEGTQAGNGMVSFANVLSADEIEAIRAYVLAQAHAGQPGGD
jgi:PQQ-dependent dehydrogenase (methanol/ethanol family)